MDVIEIDCPKCSTPLELDAAFAGGVCRCSECGTLMAVPADASQEAEALSRPDAPAGGRAESPAGGRADSPVSVRPDAPGGRPDSPGSSGITPPPGSTELAAADTTEIESLASTTAAEVYVTPSGRTVHVDKHAKVPTAQRRKKVIKATAIALLVLFTAALAIGIILFANMLFSGDDGPEKPKELIGVDPDKNPLIDNTNANLLGIELGKDVAILIDGSGFAADWLPQMRDVVYTAVERSPQAQFLVIAWTDLGNSVYPKEKAGKIAKDDLPKFRRFIDRIPSIAPAKPIEAVNEALKQRMDQIILITGQRLEVADSKTIKEAVDAKVDTRFDVILITDAGDHDPGLEEVADDNEGKYIKVTKRKLEAWHTAWKDKQSGTPTPTPTPTKDGAKKDGTKKDGDGKDATK